MSPAECSAPAWSSGLTEDLYPGAGYNGLLVLPEDAELGADVKELTGLDDWIFDISLTANRPDCQSILGIAREVSAMLEKPLKMPATDYTETDVEKKASLSAWKLRNSARVTALITYMT